MSNAGLHFRETEPNVFRRPAGLTEANFYYYAKSDLQAPSDIFSRAGCRVKGVKISNERIQKAWQYLRARHPLMDAHWIFDGSPSPKTLYLAYNATQRESCAQESISFHEMFDTWEGERRHLLNCPRILADELLAVLRVYQSSTDLQFVFIISHAIADGMSALGLIKDFLHVLDGNTEIYVPTIQDSLARLPAAAEDYYPSRIVVRTIRNKWRHAILKVIADARRNKIVDIAYWPSSSSVSPQCEQDTYEFSVNVTGKIIYECKLREFTVGHLIVACQAAAFANLVQSDASYLFCGTPGNARQYFDKIYQNRRDDLLVALAFFDILLPAVSIQRNCGDRKHTQARIWALTSLAKKQFRRSRDPFFTDLTLVDARTRFNSLVAASGGRVAAQSGRKVPLSFGSSSVGRLSHFIPPESRISIEEFNVGVRARAGESLMHSYTFNGKLTLSLCYDGNLGDVMKAWLYETAQLMEFIITSARSSSI